MRRKTRYEDNWAGFLVWVILLLAAAAGGVGGWLLLGDIGIVAALVAAAAVLFLVLVAPLMFIKPRRVWRCLGCKTVIDRW